MSEAEATTPVRVTVEASNVVELARVFKPNLTDTSVFCKSDDPLPTGSEVTVEVLFNTGERALFGLGEVVWSGAGGMSIDLEWDDTSAPRVKTILGTPTRPPPSPEAEAKAALLPSAPPAAPQPESPASEPPRDPALPPPLPKKRASSQAIAPSPDVPIDDDPTERQSVPPELLSPSAQPPFNDADADDTEEQPVRSAQPRDGSAVPSSPPQRTPPPPRPPPSSPPHGGPSQGPPGIGQPPRRVPPRRGPPPGRRSPPGTPAPGRVHRPAPPTTEAEPKKSNGAPPLDPALSPISVSYALGDAELVTIVTRGGSRSGGRSDKLTLSEHDAKELIMNVFEGDRRGVDSLGALSLFHLSEYASVRIEVEVADEAVVMVRLTDEDRDRSVEGRFASSYTPRAVRKAIAEAEPEAAGVVGWFKKKLGRNT